jgi:ribosomal protein S27AE
MFKDNGRFKPAKKQELANLKGKHMVCPECGEYAIFANVKFAETKCGKCGAKLVDADMSTASKTTG